MDRVISVSAKEGVALALEYGFRKQVAEEEGDV